MAPYLSSRARLNGEDKAVYVLAFVQEKRRGELPRARSLCVDLLGNSGSSIFNLDGDIVGLHNSWDKTTAKRHGVPYDTTVAFLKKHLVRFEFDRDEWRARELKRVLN